VRRQNLDPPASHHYPRGAVSPSNESYVTALVAALSPAEARGGAALVAGSTARQRREVVDAAMRALESARPRWVFVRLGARSGGARLADALTVAVDEALDAAHAPGELRDDAGAALAGRTGSWLYRARAAGREGIAIALDDLDAWIDARGAAAPFTDLTALLAASKRGPLAVLASSRAAAASGAPALVGDALAGFDAAVSLGGAPVTVTRDPSTLVAALAGRSFNLAGLQDALAGWLELPPPAPDHALDDTLIVFSSPLGPPPLPVDPSFTLPLSAPSAPAPARAAAPVSRDDVARWSTGLRAAIDLGAAVRRARTSDVASPREAERCFAESVSKIPRGLTQMAAVASSAGVEMRNLEAASRAALAGFDARFEAVLREVEGGGRGVTRVEDLAAEMGAHAARTHARSTAVVVLPGLRYDGWERFKTRVLAAIAGLAPTEEQGVAWSLPGDDRVEETPVAEAVTPRREHRGSVEVMRVPAYAVALREGVDDARLEAVEAALVPALRALCGGFAGRTAVLFAAERAAGEGAAEGRSAFAVLVPWGLYTYGVRNS
jgi:hypothetical protein